MQIELSKYDRIDVLYNGELFHICGAGDSIDFIFAGNKNTKSWKADEWRDSKEDQSQQITVYFKEKK